MSETTDDDNWMEYRPTDMVTNPAASAYIAKLERHVGILQDKLWQATKGETCACGWDDPEDVCMVHSAPPTVAA